MVEGLFRLITNINFFYVFLIIEVHDSLGFEDSFLKVESLYIAPAYFSSQQRQQWNEINELLPHLSSFSFDAENTAIEKVRKETRELLKKIISLNSIEHPKKFSKVYNDNKQQTLPLTGTKQQCKLVSTQYVDIINFNKDNNAFKELIEIFNNSNVYNSFHSIAYKSFQSLFQGFFKKMFEFSKAIDTTKHSIRIIESYRKRIEGLLHYYVQGEKELLIEKETIEKFREKLKDSVFKEEKFKKILKKLEEIKSANSTVRRSISEGEDTNFKETNKEAIEIFQKYEKIYKHILNKEESVAIIYNEVHWRIVKLLYSFRPQLYNPRSLNRLICYMPQSIMYIQGKSEIFPTLQAVQSPILAQGFSDSFTPLQIFNFFYYHNSALEIPLLSWKPNNKPFIWSVAAEYYLPINADDIKSIKNSCYMVSVSDQIIKKLIGKDILDLYPNFLDYFPESPKTSRVIAKSGESSIIESAERDQKSALKKVKKAKRKKVISKESADKGTSIIKYEIEVGEQQGQQSCEILETPAIGNKEELDSIIMVDPPVASKKEEASSIAFDNDFRNSSDLLNEERENWYRVLEEYKNKEKNQKKSSSIPVVYSIEGKSDLNPYQSKFLEFPKHKQEAIEKLFFEKELTYLEFKSAWGFLGGWVNKKTGSSHHQIIAPGGKIIGKGICKPHGKRSSYGPAYRKFLILPFEELGITIDFLKSDTSRV